MEETVEQTAVLDMGDACLQIMQDTHPVSGWLSRNIVAPTLSKNNDGLFVLSLRNQGEHGKFDVPYVENNVIYASAEFGVVVVLVAYHGTETYGRRNDTRVQKGQFYRYFRQESSGDWTTMQWKDFNDEFRRMIIETVEEQGPQWAKKPGKLNAERRPPAPVALMTAYKVVRLIEGRFYSLYDPTQEYILGKRLKQAAKPHHAGGFFSYPTLEDGQSYLTSCVQFIPFHEEVETSELALLAVQIGGRVINYGHKLCSTYLRPLEVLEMRSIPESSLS